MILHRSIFRAFLPLAIATAVVAPGTAFAQKAKPAPKGSVVVTNARSATLVELALVSRNKKVEPVIVARGLAAGTASRAALPKNGGCIYDVDGVFDDETTVEIAGLNLCKDGNLRLVE